MQLYLQLSSFCKQIAPTWRKSQRENLALLCSALYERRSLTLSELARAYPVPHQRKVPCPRHGLLHRLKRLWRFLHNPRLDQAALMLRFSRLSCSLCRCPGLLLPVLVDFTYFEPFAVLSASVPRAGRALPIAWHTFRRDLQGEEQGSQNLLVQSLLKQMRESLVPDIQTVIVADREFARASLFRFLRTKKVSYVIRVDAQTWVWHSDYEGPLAGLGLEAGGRRLWLQGALYGQEHREPVNLLALWAAGQEEAWYIVSDLQDAQLVQRLYRTRMKIEHGFRDWKHHLRLKGTLKAKLSQSVVGLVLGIVVLYWYLCLLGMRVKGRWLEGEVRAWGKLGDCKLGMEVAGLGGELLSRLGERVIAWAQDKLTGLSPLPPTHQLRYLRYRHPSLSG